MKAIGYEAVGPVDGSGRLIAFDAPEPSLGPRDVLVQVHGISVNPVDVKLRVRRAPENGPDILGFDAAGVVRDIGSAVTDYQIGDAVYYAGDITRSGSNAEFQAVDERIVGRKPTSLDFTDAAGIPLTAITAWEILFDAFRLAEGQGSGQAMLIVGGAGGVGSILIQLAKKLTGLTVIATASRPETQDWVRRMGADHVVDHRGDLAAQIKTLGRQIDYVSALTATEEHWPAIVELIAPRGHVTLIDDPDALDITIAKPKALTISWELMFTRSMFETSDMTVQRDLLNRVSAMLDTGALVSTVTERAAALSVDTLAAAHLRQESGSVIGKQVLPGF